MALTRQFIEMQEAYEAKLADLKAKLKESESKAKTYAKEIVFLDKKLENLNKEFELAQEHNEKTVEYWQNECSQLKQQLEEKDRAVEGLQEINQSLGQTCNNDAKEIERLREQLAEKDELLRQKIGKMKSTDFIRMCVSCGFMVQAKQNDNQTAIDELEKAKEWCQERHDGWDKSDNNELLKGGVCFALKNIIIKLDQQIQSLKGEK